MGVYRREAGNRLKKGEKNGGTCSEKGVVRPGVGKLWLGERRREK